MTILERLATTKARIVVDLIEQHKATRNTEANASNSAAWKNDPSWDNWKQNPPAWKKKRIYFRKK